MIETKRRRQTRREKGRKKMELDSEKGKLESDLNFFSQTSSSGSTSSQEKPLGVFGILLSLQFRILFCIFIAVKKITVNYIN